MKHFRNLNILKGVEIKPQKRQLLAHTAVKVEKYMAEKLFFSCIQICAPFICQPNRFLSTYEEIAKGKQILENLVFSITGEALSRYNNK